MIRGKMWSEALFQVNWLMLQKYNNQDIMDRCQSLFFGEGWLYTISSRASNATASEVF